MSVQLEERRGPGCGRLTARRVLFGAVLGALLSCSPAARAATQTFWIAPNGDDANPGTQGSPFRTPERAVEAIGGTAADKDAGDAVTVVLADGTYRLARPLAFDPRRFGPNGPHVTFRAAPGANPALSGAIQVKARDVERSRLAPP